MAASQSAHERFIDSAGTRWTIERQSSPDRIVSDRAVARVLAGKYLDRDSVNRLIGDRSERVTKFSPDQPRDEHGRFAAGGGGAAPAEPERSLADRWETMSETEKLRAGNISAIPKQMQDSLAGLRSDEPQHHDVPTEPSDQAFAAVYANAQARLDSYAHALPADSVAYLRNELPGAIEELQSAGYPKSGNMKDLDTFMSHQVDALVYQEQQGWARQLGDHGIHHILEDADGIRNIADVVDAKLNNVDTAERTLAVQASYLHDMGYTADAARTTIAGTGYHQQYGEQYIQSQRPLLEPVFGKEGVDRMAALIETHQGTGIDWNHDPVGSALRVSDNMALFEKEKAPPIARYVPQTVSILEEMALGTRSFDDLKQELKARVEQANVSGPMKVGLRQAADEMFPKSPKFTLGMFAGEMGKPSFDGKTLDVPVHYSSRAAALQSYFDLGQRQFLKFAESYGVPEEKVATGEFTVVHDRVPVLHAHVVGAPQGVFKWAWFGTTAVLIRSQDQIEKYSPDQPRDSHGRFGSGDMPKSQLSAAYDTKGSRAAASFLLDKLPQDQNSSLPVTDVTQVSDDVRGTIKSGIVDSLAEKLGGSQAFRDFAQQSYPTSNSDTAVRQLTDRYVKLWAGTSADAHEDAVLMQQATEKEFNIKGAAHPWSGDFPKGVQGSAQELQAMQHFQRAQYDVTQAAFRAAGISEVSLVRGMATEPGEEAKAAKAGSSGIERDITLQPVSSFSTNLETARDFSIKYTGKGHEGSIVLFAKIPVDRVLSTSRTGVGCLTEGEYTVLGGKSKVRAVATTKLSYD